MLSHARLSASQIYTWVSPIWTGFPFWLLPLSDSGMPTWLMALMVTKLSSKIIFRSNSILKQRQRCKEFASARRTTTHDRNPTDFLENDKCPPISGYLLLRSQNARLEAAPWSSGPILGKELRRTQAGRSLLRRLEHARALSLQTIYSASCQSMG